MVRSIENRLRLLTEMVDSLLEILPASKLNNRMIV